MTISLCPSSILRIEWYLQTLSLQLKFDLKQKLKQILDQLIKINFADFQINEQISLNI